MKTFTLPDTPKHHLDALPGVYSLPSGCFIVHSYYDNGARYGAYFLSPQGIYFSPTWVFPDERGRLVMRNIKRPRLSSYIGANGGGPAHAYTRKSTRCHPDFYAVTIDKPRNKPATNYDPFFLLSCLFDTPAVVVVNTKTRQAHAITTGLHYPLASPSHNGETILLIAKRHAAILDNPLI